MSRELYNANIERAVLSAIIFDPSLLDDVGDMLKDRSFFMPFHKKVFEAILYLKDNKKPITEEFIIVKLANDFEEQSFIELLSSSPITNIVEYTKQLNEYAKLREIIELSNQMKKSTTEDNKDSSEIIMEIDTTIKTILDFSSDDKNKSIKELLFDFECEMQNAVEGKETSYKCGITSVDISVGGFEAGDLVIIAARPSMGKTSLATFIADYALQNGHGVLFDSLEMPASKILRRFISARADERLHDLKHGRLRNIEKYNQAKDFYSRAEIFLHDSKNMNVMALRSKAIKIFRKNPTVKYWFIDHLRWIKTPGQDIAREVGSAIKILKDTAKEYGVVLFALSQLNRANEARTNKRPMLSDLRDSGAVEEDADVVLFCHRDSYYQRNENEKEPAITPAEIIIGKNREGEVGICKCYFEGAMARFVNYSYNAEYANNNERVELPAI